MLKKLRLKFVLTNMGIVATMLLIIFGLVFHFTKADLNKQGADALHTLSQPNQQLEKPDPSIRLPYFSIQMNVWGEMIVSGNTRYDLTDEVFLNELMQLVYERNSSSGMLREYDLLYSSVSTVTAQRLIFVDVSSHSAALASLTQVGILIGIASLVAFLVISILLARWSIRPVAEAWQQQRQFVSDASHELKTPLTVIMSNAELLKETQDDAQATEYADHILTMSYRMRDLVGGLLELARADNGQVEKTFTQLDYSKLIFDALLPFEPVLFEQGMTLQSSIEPGICLLGSEIYLQQLIGILLDNAGKYGCAGIVDVTLKRQGRSQCLLTVSNPGEPIPKEQLTRIFERFYRADRARTGTGSFGLGLSIAQGVVRSHGGKIWARSNPTGNCFSVQLPCMPQ